MRAMYNTVAAGDREVKELVESTREDFEKLLKQTNHDMYRKNAETTNTFKSHIREMGKI